MPDTLIKFKTGALSKLEGGATDEVGINEGTIYFATDSTDNTGKIWFDDSNGNRIDMTAYSQESEYAALANNVDGIVAVANGGTGASSAATARTNLGITPENLGISATTSSVTVGSTTFSKYTHPTGAGNNHIPSGGSSGQFLGWSAAGTATWVNNPNTDIKQNITLGTTTKAFLTGVSTTPTETAQALTGIADTGVYLTTTAGEINATQYKVNEKAYVHYDTTNDAIAFTFI